MYGDRRCPEFIDGMHRFLDVVKLNKLKNGFMICPCDECLMHVKCIHELCTISLIFQSYLHHIRVIPLLFNDFMSINFFIVLYPRSEI